jgi:lysophospholipase L1-like esterase
LGYNELLINTKRFSLDLLEVETATANLFKEYAELANQNGAQMLIVFLPNKYEVETQYPDYFLSLIEDITKMKVSTCDLRSFYMTHATTIDSYYWIDNGHHNARGYELMSEGVLQSIKNNGLLKTDSTCVGL